MGVKQVQHVSGLMKHRDLSIGALPAESQDLDYRVRETPFLAKNQAILLSLGGCSQGLQAYSFSCATTHISREAAGHSPSRGNTRPFVGADLPPATAGPPPHTHTQELPLYISHGPPTCCSSSFTSGELSAASSLSGIAEAIAAGM